MCGNATDLRLCSLFQSQSLKWFDELQYQVYVLEAKFIIVLFISGSKDHVNYMKMLS